MNTKKKLFSVYFKYVNPYLFMKYVFVFTVDIIIIIYIKNKAVAHNKMRIDPRFDY